MIDSTGRGSDFGDAATVEFSLRDGHATAAHNPPADPPAAQVRSRPSRLYVLDLLRFAAAMAVVGFHLLNEGRMGWGVDTSQLFGYPVKYAFKYGWMGVDLFFVISGFVICMSCWGRSVSDFFVSRVTRLMPAYLVAVVLTGAVLTLWPTSAGRPQPSHVLANLTMVQTLLKVPNLDTVYWTLFIELKFYLLFAVLAYFGLTYRRVVAFCMIWTVGALYAEYSGFYLARLILEPTYAPYFVAGMTLYLMHRFGPNLILWGLLGVSFVLCTQRVFPRLKHYNDFGLKLSYPLAVAILAGIFLVMTAAAMGWFAWVTWRGTVVVGALTYPVYLLHFELSQVAIGRLHDAVPRQLLFVLLVATVLGLAYLVHRMVERPAGRWLRTRLRAAFAQIRAFDTAAGPPAGPAPKPRPPG